MSINQMRYAQASREVYLFYMREAQAKRGKQGACVSAPEDGATYYLARDGQSGFALHGNEFCGVFSAAKGRLARMVTLARHECKRAGHMRMTLTCFAPLRDVYARHGFFVTGDVAFDWEQAPEGWTADMGEPDVLFMATPLMEARAAA